ncbi:hypothetical protein FAM18110_01140 [Lacticaseibacillus paracasei]|nr:hypothetical protein FAM18110_01140 [Lacticaseibacillus paracasei]
MPKPTFFRLPEAKQKRLMDAANKEFARAPFNDASISHMVDCKINPNAVRTKKISFL